MTSPDSAVNQLLAAWRAGSEEAAGRLLPIVYEELRRRAHRVRRGHHGHETLNTTALVHEAYLKLVDQAHAGWEDRSHFLAVASTAMRHVLVDHARERGALKRGGALLRVELEEDTIAADREAESLLDLHDALVELAQADPRLARVVECRFFGGLTEEETAEALGVTARTVRRDWIKSKALLHARLGA